MDVPEDSKAHAREDAKNTANTAAPIDAGTITPGWVVFLDIVFALYVAVVMVGSLGILIFHPPDEYTERLENMGDIAHVAGVFAGVLFAYLMKKYVLLIPVHKK